MALARERYIEGLFVLCAMLLLFTAGFTFFLNERNVEKIESLSYSQLSNEIRRQVFGDPDSFDGAEEHHWDHMPITYKYPTCLETFDGRIALDIESAVYYFSKKTDFLITFERIDDSRKADIEFVCDIGAVETRRNRAHSNGEITEAEAVINFETPLIFAPGKIYIYSTYPCIGQRPTMVLHELGHMFDLRHNVRPSYSNDIMHPYVNDNCDADFLDKDVEYLKEIYG